MQMFCGGFPRFLFQGVTQVPLRYRELTGNLLNAPRLAREPDMTPVSLEVVSSYLKGSTSRAALLEASQRNPEVRELMLDTRAFLRGGPETDP